MTVVTIFTSCDEHRDFLDTGMKIGHVLCTDGNVMSFQQYEVRQGGNCGSIPYQY